MEFGTAIGLAITFILVVTVFKGVRMVPQQSVWIVEKLGKFDRALEPGLNFLLPYVETVAYKHSLKEYAMDVA
jgi:regulator of protease activity HflC (stomatin/prohibitin superfamily)